MAERLEKVLRYRLTAGGTFQLWVPPVVTTKTTRVYGDPIPIGSSGGQGSVRNCRQQTLVDGNGDVIEIFFVCETTFFDLDKDYSADILAVHGPLLEVLTETLVTPGYFETIQAAPGLEPVLNLGWNAGAVSQSSFIRNGRASFTIETDVVGVVVGLNTLTQAVQNVGYQDIHHGFYISRGEYRIVEKNTFQTALVAFNHSASFEIEVNGADVKYLLDGNQVYSALSTLGDADVVLDASLYVGGDRVYNATLENTDDVVIPAGTEIVTVTEGSEPNVVFGGRAILAVDDGTANVVFGGQSALDIQQRETVTTVTVIPNGSQPEVVFAGSAALEVDDGSVNVVFGGTSALSVQQSPATTGTTLPSVLPGTAQGVFETLQISGSAGNYTEASLTFEALEMAANAGLSVVRFGAGVLTLPVLTMAAGLYNKGNVRVAFEPLQMSASDGVYAEARMTLEPLSVVAFDAPEFELGVAQIVYLPPDPLQGAYGNGTLLRSGRHLLTAAHVVAVMPDLAFIEVRFFAGTQFEVELIPVESVVFHPGYEILYDGDGSTALAHINDLAIITLADEAHPLIRRHNVYTGDNELGNDYTRLSFSPHFDPITGTQLDPEFDRWTKTNNKYEVYNDTVESLTNAALNFPSRSLLVFDCDAGTAVSDTLGNFLQSPQKGVPNEGFVQPGDSGSAGFIGNGVIAGISSYISSPNGLTGVYGSLGFDVRISQYTTWVNENSGGVGVFEAGNVATNIEANLDLIEFDIDAHAVKTSVYGVNLDLIEFDIDATTGAQANLDLIEFDIDASVTQFALLAGNLDLLQFDIDATAVTGGLTNVDLDLLEFDIDATGGANAALEVVFDLTVDATSTLTQTTNVDLDLLEFDIDAASTLLLRPGVADISLFELEAVHGLADVIALIDFETVDEDALVVETTKAYSMNLLHGEITVYSNYAFDRVVRLNGDYYGIKTDGLYLLRGADDDGLKIAGTIKTGRMDFATAKLKRVPYVYLDSQHKTSVQPFAENVSLGRFNSTHEGRRTRLPRGANARFWSFRVSNVNGGELDLRSLEIYANVLTRKVR